MKKGEELEILATKQTEMEKSDKVFGVGSTYVKAEKGIGGSEEL